MYRINKDKGNNQNITLTNVETKASVIIGKLTMAIMRVLEKEVEFDESKEDTIKLASLFKYFLFIDIHTFQYRSSKSYDLSNIKVI